MKTYLRYLILLLAGAGLLAIPALSSTPADSNLVRVVVTAVGRDGTPPAPVTRDSLLVFQDKERRPIMDWVPAQGEQAPADLVIFVDDNLHTGFGAQLGDLTEFVHSLPASTRVAVAYASNGAASLRQDFTTDHEAAARALRIPIGSAEAFSSPYLSLVDLLKRLPDDGHRREVLMISDGIDLFRGVAESSPSLNFDLQRAIELAQRRGVVVHTLFARGAGFFHRNLFLINNGQGGLTRLAYETGGQSYFQGLDTPVSLAPFLNRVAESLGQQYVLTFRASLGKKAGYQRLRVTAEVPGVELIAPARVYIPAAE